MSIIQNNDMILGAWVVVRSRGMRMSNIDLQLGRRHEYLIWISVFFCLFVKVYV